MNEKTGLTVKKGKTFVYWKAGTPENKSWLFLMSRVS